MPYNPAVVNISSITEEVSSSFQSKAKEKQLDLISNIKNDLEVYADANALKTIVRNLIDNAIKYTHEGGRIELNAITDQKGIKIQISDSGIGMSKNQLRDIFLLQKDKSVDGTAGEKGTGLGMHLVNELVKLNKGAIKVISELHQGTTFEVLLPMIPKEG